MPGAEDKDLKKDPPGAGADDKDPKDPSKVKPGADDDADDDGDDFADPVKAQAEIKKLRGEAAKYRTKSKGLEDKMTALDDKFSKLKKAIGGDDEDEIDPEEKVKKLQAKTEALEMELSVKELCIEHEIPKAQQKYFRFLLAEKFEVLEENEEMTDEMVQEIALEARQMSGEKKPVSTGLKKGGEKPPDGGKVAMTVEQFLALSVAEKSLLYTKNLPEYNRLFEAAKGTKKL